VCNGTRDLMKGDTTLPHGARSPADISEVCGEFYLNVATPDDRALALLFIAAWAARTRRVLRPVPVSELSSEELVNFWADDQLEQPLDAPVHRWLPR
jgi:hypothetical protein